MINIAYNTIIRQIDEDYLKISNHHIYKFIDGLKVLTLDECDDKIFVIFKIWFDDLNKLGIVKIPEILKHGCFIFKHTNFINFSKKFLQKLYVFAEANQIELLVNTLKFVSTPSEMIAYEYTLVLINILQIPNLIIIEDFNEEEADYFNKQDDEQYFKPEFIDILFIHQEPRIEYQPYIVVESHDFDEIMFGDFDRCFKYFHHSTHDKIVLNEDTLNFLNDKNLIPKDLSFKNLKYKDTTPNDLSFKNLLFNNLPFKNMILKITSSKDATLKNTPKEVTLKKPQPKDLQQISENVFGNKEAIYKIDLKEKLLNISAITLNSSLIFVDYLTKQFSIPKTFTSINYSLFYNCPCLTYLSVPSTVTEINFQAFRKCENLININLGDGVKYLGISAFGGCKNLKSIRLSTNLLKIDDMAFNDCLSLQIISIPNNVLTIGCFAFNGCENLTTIILSDKLTKISPGMFYNCLNIRSVNLPNSVSEIGYSAFAYCSKLSNINLNNVLWIDYDAFKNCKSLKRLVIPKTTVVHGSAFVGCN